MEERLNVGDIVYHFKRNTYLHDVYGYSDNGDDLTYIYQIIGIATHSETKEKFVVYKSLYANKYLGVSVNQLFIRPYDMFMSEVDREKYPIEKYPYMTSTYRFEKLQFR